jgi:hypothetical protein
VYLLLLEGWRIMSLLGRLLMVVFVVGVGLLELVYLLLLVVLACCCWL